MKRYCHCGRAIWVVFRRGESASATVFYDGGEENVWMPITACPQCRETLSAGALEDYIPVDACFADELSVQAM